MAVGPHGQKRPGDVVGNAVHCCKVLVGDAEETVTGQRNSGDARAASLSPERRRETAKKAAAARWNGRSRSA